MAERCGIALQCIFVVLALFFTMPNTGHAEDASGGEYAKTYAKRLLARSDRNDDGLIEKAEAEREWRSLAGVDANRDQALSFDELTKVPIPYLASQGETKLNLLYKKTDDEDLFLDLYYPTNRTSKRVPVVIYTHGGGWSAGSKHGITSPNFQKLYLALLEKGIAVAAVNYRLCRQDGSVVMRDCVIDAKDAVRYLAKNSDRLGIDQMRFVVHGDSAGGHIAQMMLLSPPRSFEGDPTVSDATFRMIAGVSWYGPCDFEKVELFNHDDRPDFRDRFGARIIKPNADSKNKLALYREMSPIQYLNQESPSLMMIQGDKDTTIPVKHAYYMREKAEAVRAPVEIIIVKNAGHNWREVDAPITPAIEEIVERTVAFLTENLRFDSVAR
jgi:acetyl esterase/lipase